MSFRHNWRNWFRESARKARMAVSQYLRRRSNPTRSIRNRGCHGREPEPVPLLHAGRCRLPQVPVDIILRAGRECLHWHGGGFDDPYGLRHATQSQLATKIRGKFWVAARDEQWRAVTGSAISSPPASRFHSVQFPPTQRFGLVVVSDADRHHGNLVSLAAPQRRDWKTS